MRYNIEKWSNTYIIIITIYFHVNSTNICTLYIFDYCFHICAFWWHCYYYFDVIFIKLYFTYNNKIFVFSIFIENVSWFFPFKCEFNKREKHSHNEVNPFLHSSKIWIRNLNACQRIVSQLFILFNQCCSLASLLFIQKYREKQHTQTASNDPKSCHWTTTAAATTTQNSFEFLYLFKKFLSQISPKINVFNIFRFFSLWFLYSAVWRVAHAFKNVFHRRSP